MPRRHVVPTATLDQIADAPADAVLLPEDLKHQLRLRALSALAALHTRPPVDEGPDLILDAKGAAALLHISPNAVLRNPNLPRLKTGSRRTVRYSRRRLIQFMERGR